MRARLLQAVRTDALPRSPWSRRFEAVQPQSVTT
jgi:hypothetical protein